MGGARRPDGGGGCAATALLGLRGHPHARLTASATAAVAVLDAWFDITIARPGAALAQALACAVAEAALAGACVFLAVSRWGTSRAETCRQETRRQESYQRET